MPNIKPFSLFPTLSDNLLSNRFDQFVLLNIESYLDGNMAKQSVTQQSVT
ncbi:hypothetical protein [Proteus mirabilis]|nr:hypothetical protein [Klebsiella pneumoniae]MCT8207098.1 hypothetical protein [Proteus mirabilis]